MSSLLLKRESPFIPVILVVLLLGCWSELDLYAPSFPKMMHHFGTNEQVMQWTLSLNFFGFFMASLLCGPLADSFGRRKVIIFGTLIFVVGSFLCMMAPTIEWMLLGRLIQGIGVSAPVTVCNAVVADLYQGERLIKTFSRINSTITISMAFAPLLGVYLMEEFGWRSNFIAIFAIAVFGILLIFLFIPETLEEKLRVPFSTKGLIKNYKFLLFHKDFLAAMLGCCFWITPYFILIGILPLLYLEVFKVSIDSYALYQGSVVGLFAVLSLAMPFILSRLKASFIFHSSLTLSLIGIVGALILSFFFGDNPNVIIVFMWMYVMGMTLPPTMMFATAMDLVPELRASSSSLIQAVRMLFMSIGTAIAGKVYNGTFPAVGAVMLGFLLLAIPMAFKAFSKKSDENKKYEYTPNH